MNNDANNLNGNNNLNGSVLGSVDMTPNVNNNPVNNNVGMQPESLDTLNTPPVTPVNPTQSMVMDSNPINVEPAVGSEVPLSQTNQNTEPTPSNVGLNDQVMNNTNTVNNSQVVNEPTNNTPNGTYVANPTPANPEPAYTNPQSINPMPGFDNAGSIGTTPPISLEPDKKPKKPKNKTLFIVLILVLLLGIGMGVYYILKYTNILNNNSNSQVIIDAKAIELNLGDTLSPNIVDYANISGTDIKNCSLNTLGVDTSKEGVYNYNITCGNIQKSGTITVVDNTELVVNTKKVYKSSGDTLEASEFIVGNESYSYEFVDADTVNGYLEGEKGTYTVKIKVTAGNKTQEIDGELVILEHAIKGYLVCKSNEQNVGNDSSATMIVQEKIAIVDRSNTVKNVYGNVAIEEHIFKFTDETEYTNYLAKYNTEGSITINDITGNATFDDENLTITIQNEKTDAEVQTEFNITNESEFVTIRSHFETTLKYTCSYERD